MVKIYYLESNNIIFYIGKTKNNLSLRIGRHKEKFDGIFNNITIQLLDEVEESEWKFWECYWIQQFKVWGFKLSNQNNGGGGPERHTIETLKKMSQNMKGKIHSDETKDKMSKSHLGTKCSIVTKQKMSNTKKGKCYHPPHNEETRRKISESKIGNNHKKGKKLSQLSKDNIGKAKIGNKYALGYKFTEEQKQKISKPKNHGNKIKLIKQKPILQYDLEGNFIKEWPSAKLAYDELNISNSINACAAGKIKKSHGFKWEYKLKNYEKN